MSLVIHRFRGKGLYLLDEPEAALSPTRQLALLVRLTHKLYITVHTVGTAQALDHEHVFDAKGAPLAKIEPGFQTAFGDLGFVGKFGAHPRGSSCTPSCRCA